MQNLPPHIDYIEGKHNGPCVVILGSIHGNERLGEAVIAKIRHKVHSEDLYGDLILILGNPNAYAAHQRFIDCDLNRLFGPEINALLQKPYHMLNMEEKRAIEITPFLQMADYLLDIHSTIKPSVPFIYCERTKRHFEFAHLFQPEYIVSSASHCRIPDLISCTDSYVDRNGGIGITYEAGWHRGPTIFPEVLEKTYTFLQYIGSIKATSITPSSKKIPLPVQLVIYDYVIAQTPHFHFTKDFANFDMVQEGEVIAQDEGKLFKAKKKSFVVFPKIDFIPKTPACYLARKAIKSLNIS